MIYTGYENPKTGNKVCCRCDECGLDDGQAVRRHKAYKDFGDWQADHLGCDKTQLPFFAGGCCDDAFVEIPDKPDSAGGKSRSRLYRREKNRRAFEREKRTAAVTGFKPTALGYLNDEGTHFKHGKNSYRKRFLKTQANRRVRRCKDHERRGSYKKEYNLDYNLW